MLLRDDIVWHRRWASDVEPRWNSVRSLPAGAPSSPLLPLNPAHVDLVAKADSATGMAAFSAARATGGVDGSAVGRAARQSREGGESLDMGPATILEFFQMCDIEDKGFITLRDMQVRVEELNFCVKIFEPAEPVCGIKLSLRKPQKGIIQGLIEFCTSFAWKPLDYFCTFPPPLLYSYLDERSKTAHTLQKRSDGCGEAFVLRLLHGHCAADSPAPHIFMSAPLMEHLSALHCINTKSGALITGYGRPARGCFISRNLRLKWYLYKFRMAWCARGVAPRPLRKFYFFFFSASHEDVCHCERSSGFTAEVFADPADMFRPDNTLLQEQLIIWHRSCSLSRSLSSLCSCLSLDSEGDLGQQLLKCKHFGWVSFNLFPLEKKKKTG